MDTYGHLFFFLLPQDLLGIKVIVMISIHKLISIYSFASGQNPFSVDRDVASYAVLQGCMDVVKVL